MRRSTSSGIGGIVGFGTGVEEARGIDMDCATSKARPEHPEKMLTTNANVKQ